MRRVGVGYHDAMSRSVMRWVVIGVSVLVAGPVAGAVVAAIPAGDGSHDATALLSASPFFGLLMSVVAIGIATVMGVVGSRLVGPRTGLMCMGCVLTWAAMSTAQLDELARRGVGTGGLRVLAVEGLLLGLVAMAGGWLTIRAARDEPAASRPEILSRAGALGVVVGVVVGLVVVFAVAQSTRSGQVIAATGLALLAGTTLGMVASQRAPMEAFLACGVVLAVACPALGAFLGSGSLLEQVNTGSTPTVARPMPFHWLAGLFLGMPVGAWWAKSMTEKHPAEA